MADTDAVVAAAIQYGEQVTKEVTSKFADLNNQITNLTGLLEMANNTIAEQGLTITTQAARITELESSIQ